MCSSDLQYLAVAHGGSPYVTVYKRDGDTLTKIANPDVLPAGNGYGVSWSPDGQYLAVGHNNSPFITVYRNDPLTTVLSMTRRWTFAAGVGTGVIREIALRSSSTSPWSSSWVARQVLSTPIDKTQFHELDVEWTLEVLVPQAFEGTIPNGQRDGSSIDWAYHLYPVHAVYLFASQDTSYRPAWFGITGTPSLHVSQSNDEPDILWVQPAQKAPFNEDLSGTGLRTPDPYTPGSLSRTVRINLDVHQANNGPVGALSLSGLGYITFDPPLDKVDTHRLYVDVTISLQRE